MPSRSTRLKKRRDPRAPHATIQFESIEKVVRHPELRSAVVVLKTGEEKLLSKEELRESARQMLVRETKTPARQIGRHVVRVLHDLAAEALEKIDVSNRGAAGEIAEHLWRGSRVLCLAEIAGEVRAFRPWLYLVPSIVGPDGFPVERPWEEAGPSFRAGVEKGIQAASAETDRTVDLGRPRRKKGLANWITICVLAEFEKTITHRWLHEIKAKVPATFLRRSVN